jgi:hypothetical protein
MIHVQIVLFENADEVEDRVGASSKGNDRPSSLSNCEEMVRVPCP